MFHAHLNITCLRNKSDSLTKLVLGYVGVLMTSETKLDSSFSTGQFIINSYGELFRTNHNSQE